MTHVPQLKNRSDIWTRPRLGLMKTSCSVTSRCCCVVMAGQEIPGATFGLKKKKLRYKSISAVYRYTTVQDDVHSSGLLSFLLFKVLELCHRNLLAKIAGL